MNLNVSFKLPEDFINDEDKFLDDFIKKHRAHINNSSEDQLLMIDLNEKAKNIKNNRRTKRIKKWLKSLQ